MTDDKDDELQRLCGALDLRVQELEQQIAAKNAEIESLRAECGLRQIQGYNEGKETAEREAEALRKDAERYRWLREQAGIIEPMASTVFRRNEEWCNVWDGLSLDAAVDARSKGDWRQKALAAQEK